MGLMAGGLLQAKVRLASVFGSDMVLQRQCEAPLWGWAEPGAEVAATGRGTDRPSEPVAERTENGC